MSSPGDHLRDRHQEAPAGENTSQCQGLNDALSEQAAAGQTDVLLVRAQGPSVRRADLTHTPGQLGPTAPQLESTRGAGLACNDMQEGETYVNRFQKP